MSSLKKVFLVLTIVTFFIGCSKRIDPTIKAMDAPDYRRRQNAVVKLYESKDKRTVDLLINKGLNDDDFFVRRTTVEALGKLRDKKAIAPLIKMYEKDPAIREEIALAVGQIGGQEGIRFLTELAKSRDYIERGHGVIGLAQTKNKELSSFYYHAAKDQEYFVRKRAVRAIGLLERRKDISVYKKLASDNDIHVRGYALEDIGRAGEKGLYKYIDRGLRDKDPFVRKSAVHAAGMLKSNRAVKILSELLKRDVALKKDIIRALREIGSKKVFKLFLTMLNDPDIEVRKISIDALGDFKDKRAVEPLIALYEKDPGVRKRVLIAIANIDDKRVYNFFEKIAKDKDTEEELKGYAVLGLGMFDQEKSIMLLKQFLKDNKAEIRIKAAEALSKIDDEKIIEILEEAIQKEDDDRVRVKFNEALKTLQETIDKLKRQKEKQEQRREGLR